MVKYNFSKNKPEELRKTEELIGQSINAYREQYLMPYATGHTEGLIAFLSAFMACMTPFLIALVFPVLGEGALGIVRILTLSMVWLLFFLKLAENAYSLDRFDWKDNNGHKHFYNREGLGYFGSIIAKRKLETIDMALLDTDSKLLTLEAQCDRIASVIELSNYVEGLAKQYGEDSVKFLVRKIKPQHLETEHSKGSDGNAIPKIIAIRDNYDVELCYDVEVVLSLTDYNNAVTLQGESRHFILSAPELNLIMQERDVIDFSFIDGIYNGVRGELESVSKLLNEHKYTELETLALKEPALLIEV